jgi:uncharacterized cupin superfamily protein
MKSASDIVLFHRQQPTVHDEFTTAPEKLLSGDGAQTVDNFYSDETSQFHAGLWSGGIGAWKVRYTEHEFCTLLEGRVRVTDRDGKSIELTAGDHFVIPAGFEGVWEVLEPAKKTYAIFEASR